MPNSISPFPGDQLHLIEKALVPFMIHAILHADSCKDPRITQPLTFETRLLTDAWISSRVSMQYCMYHERDHSFLDEVQWTRAGSVWDDKARQVGC